MSLSRRRQSLRRSFRKPQRLGHQRLGHQNRKPRRLGMENLEHRRVLATLGIDVEFLDVNGTELNGAVLRGQSIFVDVKIQDVRDATQGTAVGVIAIPLDYAWNQNELALGQTFDNLPAFPLLGNSVPSALVTSRFPLQRGVRELIESTNGDTELQDVRGAALPNQNLGQAIGITESETFTRLTLRTNANTDQAFFTVTLDGSMSFADAAILDQVVGRDRTTGVPGQPLSVRASIEIVGGSISGTKFDDLNRNGTQDAGEAGLPNITIRLDSDGDGDADMETLTDTEGNYEFIDLPAGDYTITEVPPANTTITTPVDGRHEVTLDQNNQNATDRDFGNATNPPETSSVSGIKFNDLNGNGIRETNEPGVPGITILLDRGNDDSPEQTAITDADGRFRFEGVVAGNYSVSEMLPARTVRTTPDINFVIDVAPPAPIDGLLFGNFSLTNLSGIKFEDIDGSGTRDANENPIEGVTVELDLLSDGTVDSSVQTGVDGRYQFLDVGPGTHLITETVPIGFVSTTPNPIVVENRSGVDRNNLDFGNQILPPVDASISGFVYTDNDFDGQFDDDEFGLAGVTVQLFLANELFAQTITQPDGRYHFTDLPDGNYRLVQVQPERFGDASITRGQVLPTGEPRGDVTGFNVFENITLSANETAIDYNFGDVLTSVTKRFFTSTANLRGQLSGVVAPVEFQINGTRGDDRITIENLGEAGIEITINDRSPIRISPDEATRVLIDALGGNDRIDYLGNEQAETIYATPSEITAQTTTQSVGVFNVEDVRVDGGGGDDFGVIRDSSQSNRINARGNVVALFSGDQPQVGFTNIPAVQAISAVDANEDTAAIEAIDFVLELAGDWVATGS